jgi:hypothetical protein
MLTLLAACAVGWGIGAVVLAGLYATMTIGVTGGPNHGEHPFIVNVLHLGVATGWAVKEWPPAARWTYLGLLAAAVLLSLAVLRLRLSSEPRKVWAARVAMAALYLGLLGVMILGR